eukprot:scaffold29471_cov28-Tisochrysis_lutea.AAC.2
MRVRAHVAILSAPLVAGRRQLIRTKRNRTRSERARDDDCTFAVPGLVLRHDAGVSGHIVGRQLRQLIRLRVDPAKWFHPLKVLVLR